jgi:hypothetical protein
MNVAQAVKIFRRMTKMADGVGFEPTDACTSPVFKTGALNHSATHPAQRADIAGRAEACKPRDQ